MSEARQFRVIRFKGNLREARREDRQLILEEPLIVQVENGPSRTLMRTPGQDEELAAGFLLSEGIAGKPGDIVSFSESPGMLAISLRQIREPGKEPSPVVASCVFPLDVFHAIPGKVKARQELFKKTGASHAAALFDARGNVLALREDLSRHCAFDKVIGWAAMGGADLGSLGIYLTSRIGAGMVGKAARMGVPLIAAVSAASAGAAEAAEKANVTLAGFVRGDEITIYAHPERIRADGKGGGDAEGK